MGSNLTKRYFPAVLRDFRQKALLTQEELSERIGVTTSYLGMMETGKRWPTVEMIFRIADALEIEPESLIKALDQERKKNY